MKLYLAGPMSGIPAFNFPAFHAATAELRKQGFEVVSPAEEDYKHGIGGIAEASKKGDGKDLPETWGTILARDVQLLADGGFDGIVFLDGWEKSKGAKLEAFVGLLNKFSFYTYDGPGNKPSRLPSWLVLETIKDNMYQPLRASA